MSTQFIRNSQDGSNHSSEPLRRDNIAVLLRGKWIILVSLVVVNALAGVYLFFARPVYEASASVLIETKGNQGIIPFSFEGVAALNRINNELETLKSQSLAQSAARKLLETKTIDVGGIERIPIIEKLGEAESTKVLASEALIMERLEAALDFKPIKESDVVRISARSSDRREAAILANVYAEAYVERNINNSRARSMAVRDFLQSQSQSKKQVLDTAEATLKQYLRSSGTTALDDKTKSVVDQLSRLEASRDAIDVDISSILKTLESYKAELALQEPAVAHNIGESNDAYIRLLQEELARLEVQRDVMIAQNSALRGGQMYGEKLKEIDDQILSLKARLRDRTSGFLNSIIPSASGEGSTTHLAQAKQKIIEQQIELEGLSARRRALGTVIAEYERQFDRIPQKSMDLAKLQRARLSSERLYLLVEEKYNEAAIAEKSEFGYVTIMDRALVPDKPVSPNLPRTVIIGVLVGLGIGILVVFFREGVNVRVRTPEDLKRLGFVSVSVLGQMGSQTKSIRESSRTMRSDGSLDPHLIAFHRPLSLMGESFQVLRMNLQSADQEQYLRSFLVTSANPSEGKSTVVSNLAITIAQNGKRVLLVDADMRRPSLHRLFNLSRDPGLSDYLLGTARFEDVVHRKVLENLDLLCSGSAPQSPAKLLSSIDMQAFIKLMLENYEVILLDSAPILIVADAGLIAGKVGGTILVVSSGDTSIREIELAKEVLDHVGGRILGALLNGFNPKKAYGYGGPYRRSEYSHEYGAYMPRRRGIVTSKRHPGKI